MLSQIKLLRSTRRSLRLAARQKLVLGANVGSRSYEPNSGAVAAPLARYPRFLREKVAQLGVG